MSGTEAHGVYGVSNCDFYLFCLTNALATVMVEYLNILAVQVREVIVEVQEGRSSIEGSQHE